MPSQCEITCQLIFLPAELVDIILDYAEYWPCISEGVKTKLSLEANFETAYNAAAYYLITPPIPKHVRHVQKIIFKLSSCDQGWGSDCLGTYNGSHTWFEAGIIRNLMALSPIEPLSQYNADQLNMMAYNGNYAREIENPSRPGERWRVQCNLTASSTVKIHKVVWYGGDIITAETEASTSQAKGAGAGRGFFEVLQSGDQVVLVVRAQYPGWTNHVYGAQVDIFYSI